MPTILTATQARDLVKMEAGADKIPLVTDAEITAILARDEFTLFTTWAAATNYPVGAMVRPTSSADAYDFEYIYRAVRGGTSGATEPDFPLSIYATIGDGEGDTEVLWQRVHVGAPRYNYALDRAIYKVLEIRLARASELSDTSEDGQTFNVNQITQNIERLMSRRRPVGVA